MNKAAKILSFSLIGILLIALVASWLLIFNLDSIVKRVVEEVGTETLGTSVTLNSAEVSLSDATAALRGLAIANPAGFKEKQAFELGAIEITIDPASATTREVVLPKILVDQAKLTFEQVGSSSNLQTLLNNIDSTPADTSGDSGDAAEEVLLVIQEFRLTGAQVTVLHDQLQQPLSFVLPDMVLRDIGRVGAGATAEEAARQIFEPILDKALDGAKGRAKQELEARAKQELDKQKGKALDSVSKKLFGR